MRKMGKNKMKIRHILTTITTTAYNTRTIVNLLNLIDVSFLSLSLVGCLVVYSEHIMIIIMRVLQMRQTQTHKKKWIKMIQSLIFEYFFFLVFVKGDGVLQTREEKKELRKEKKWWKIKTHSDTHTHRTRHSFHHESLLGIFYSLSLSLRVSIREKTFFFFLIFHSSIYSLWF